MATFSDAVLESLTSQFAVNGASVEGEAISYLSTKLRERGFVVGAVYEFEKKLASAGFVIVVGRNRRGQAARVVTKEGAWS
jgi:hypothetical protein